MYEGFRVCYTFTPKKVNQTMILVPIEYIPMRVATLIGSKRAKRQVISIRASKEIQSLTFYHVKK
ncbi:hypothetical protein BWGOE8_58040 [Bacillus mycoides]|uniref:Uncharacterized protein n=1 Tax=Bacillus mycoides TaxID=1405 RepID=A0A1E8AYH6_BACMY|nr:hypothetical protein BWGOE9_57750 [Bacillus mycoides]OFD70086.1 hypothetical protein BWGOE8_58040 [Bacillus mycoides]OFD72942.1 hypothetical protein BWGOE10_56160 [Bacillus mycoides]